MDINIFLSQYSFQQKSVITIHSSFPSCRLEKNSHLQLHCPLREIHTLASVPLMHPPVPDSLLFLQTSLSRGSWGALRILTGLWSGRKRLNHCNNTHSSASNASFFLSPFSCHSLRCHLASLPSVYLFVSFAWCFWQRCSMVFYCDNLLIVLCLFKSKYTTSTWRERSICCSFPVLQVTKVKKLPLWVLGELFISHFFTIRACVDVKFSKKELFCHSTFLLREMHVCLIDSSLSFHKQYF